MRRQQTLDDDGPGNRAVVDIGSNTVRLVIYGGPPRAPLVLHNEKVTARLGRGMDANGCLAPKAAAAALAALARFRLLLELMRIERVDVVATAAVRDAADGQHFLDRVAALGLRPRLLSGEEEAETSAFGVMAAFPGARGIVADLGGGSLELVDIDGETCSHGVSLRLGTLRLPELLSDGPGKFDRLVGRQIRKAGWQAEPGADLYLVGGSFRSLGKLALVRGAATYDDPHGLSQDRATAARLARGLVRKPPAETSAATGIGADRLAAIPATASLLAALLKHLEPGRVIYSGWGLREGLLFRALEPAVRRQDPLLAGVTAFAARQGAATDEAREICRWAAQAQAQAASAASERLRLAATLLALAASRLEPNLRAAHGLDWAMRKRWIGIERHEAALLGAAVLASCGKPDRAAGLAGLASPEALRLALCWGLGFRLCRRLGALATSVPEHSSLVRSGANLVLEVSPALSALVNDGVERDLRQLAVHLGLEPVWRVSS